MEQWMRQIVPLALMFCFSVAAGNLGLQYLNVSYVQMLTASTPFFTVIASKVFSDAQHPTMVYISMIPIVGGVSLATWKESEFALFGFLCILFATSLRAVRSVWQGKLLSEHRSNQKKLDPVSLLFYMSPPSILLLLLFVIIVEPDVFAFLSDQVKQQNAPLFFWLTVSSTVSFFLNLANFFVTMYTSAVTLQVLGNVKVVFSIMFSLYIFQNDFSPISGVGCLITLLGVHFYSRAKDSPSK